MLRVQSGDWRGCVYGTKQGLVRPPLCVHVLRQEDGPEEQVLRVRREADVQEVLREAAHGVEEAAEDVPREYDEEGVGGGSD